MWTAASPVATISQEVLHVERAGSCLPRRVYVDIITEMQRFVARLPHRASVNLLARPCRRLTAIPVLNRGFRLSPYGTSGHVENAPEVVRILRAHPLVDWLKPTWFP